MLRHPVATDHAPAAIGPYSQAMICGRLLFTSGQIPLDPATGTLVTGDIAAQTHRVFDNLHAVCAAASADFSQVVRVGIYLVDLGDFAAVNAVMAEYFNPPYPARSTIGVAALPKGARVEIDLVVALD
jgi:reactive intermediate/imine deaminase